jgi:hypothetical protein
MLPVTFPPISVPQVSAAEVLPTGPGSFMASRLARMRNAPSADLPGLLTSAVPALVEAIARLPRRDCGNLMTTSSQMYVAMGLVMDVRRSVAKPMFDCAVARDTDGVRQHLLAGNAIDQEFDTYLGDRTVRDTALTIAARNNHLDMVELLVRSERFDPDDPASAAALRIAADHDVSDTGQSVDEHEAEVDAVIPSRQRILHELLTHGVPVDSLSIRHLELSAYWEACLRLSQEDPSVMLYLCWHPKAPEAMYMGLVQLHLKNLANDQIQARDCWGQTPLHAAAAFCDGSVTRALLQRGAVPGVADSTGKRPLDAALVHGNAASVDAFLAYECQPLPWRSALHFIDVVAP